MIDLILSLKIRSPCNLSSPLRLRLRLPLVPLPQLAVRVAPAGWPFRGLTKDVPEAAEEVVLGVVLLGVDVVIGVVPELVGGGPGDAVPLVRKLVPHISLSFPIISRLTMNLNRSPKRSNLESEILKL